MDIIAFYRGEEPDYLGRSLEEILTWDDMHLEGLHNYIQVLFPLREPSLFSWYAPILDDDVVAAFRADELARANLARSFDRLLHFYGFRLDAQTRKVTRAEDFERQTQNWLAPFDHNYRRITRILRSLTALGLAELAKAWFEALTAVYDDRPEEIGEETYRYWQDAILPEK